MASTNVRSNTNTPGRAVPGQLVSIIYSSHGVYRRASFYIISLARNFVKLPQHVKFVDSLLFHQIKQTVMNSLRLVRYLTTFESKANFRVFCVSFHSLVLLIVIIYINHDRLLTNSLISFSSLLARSLACLFFT